MRWSPRSDRWPPIVEVSECGISSRKSNAQTELRWIGRDCKTKRSICVAADPWQQRPLVACTIKGAIEASSEPGAWTKIRDCSLVDCAQVHVSIATVALEGVAVDGLRRAGRSPLYLWGCAFRNVTLAGKLHGLKINVEIGLHHRRDPALQAAWTKALESFYTVDTWALDIREAYFTSVPTFEAIPGERVLFDPTRHARVRRSALNGFDARSLPMGIALDWFVHRSPFDSVVLASSSEPSRRQRDLDNLAKLRDLGIAELQ